MNRKKIHFLLYNCVSKDLKRKLACLGKNCAGFSVDLFLSHCFVITFTAPQRPVIWENKKNPTKQPNKKPTNKQKIPEHKHHPPPPKTTKTQNQTSS